jgi:UDP-GlcNAc:undecaprenyl-phosphate GlcNAc-1-phosphate transferase
MAPGVLLGMGAIEGPAAVVVLGCVPLVLAWVLTGCLIRWAPRLGLVDHPDPRKVHTRPTPRAGGLAILAAVVLTGAGAVAADHFGWSRFGLPQECFVFVAWAAPVAVLGLLDDLRPLSWQLRLGVQAMLAVGATLTVFPDAGVLLWVVVTFWVVAQTNAFNMLDNMDQLSAGVAFVVAGWLAVLAGVSGPPSSTDWAPHLILMGALWGFLWWNRSPARIFMGDAGSTFLGFVLGLATAKPALAEGGPPWSWVIPLCLAAVPCYDMTSVVLIRLSQGRSPFHPDKQHLSHRLVGRGLSPVTAVRVIHLLALASGANALILWEVRTPMTAVLVIGQLAVWWGALAIIEFVRR